MSSELKACPFCGPKGKPYLHQIGNEHCKRRGVEVGCDNCHFKKLVLTLRQPIEWAISKAAEIWNTRAQQPDAVSVVRELLARLQQSNYILANNSLDGDSYAGKILAKNHEIIPRAQAFLTAVEGV